MKAFLKKISFFEDKVNVIPIDCFRIGVGFISLLYFMRAFSHAQFFLFEDGLINHKLVQDIFWYTWQPLFIPSLSDGLIQILLSLGILLSLSLTIGLFSRICALLLYIIVVCLYRYQFLVLFVDDVIMHLLLFWCFLLPIGKTLNLVQWLRNKNILKDWVQIKTDGFIITLILFNISLIYFIAGISKFSSGLWIEGIALFAVLKLPLGWFANYQLENYELFLKLGNYFALIIEPIFVVIVFLKKWSKSKFLLGSLLLLFHIFILITLDIPFANMGCIVFATIIFHGEITDFFLKKVTPQEKTKEIFISNKNARIPGIIMIIFLTGAMICSLTQNQWRTAKRISGKSVSSEVKISSADTGGPIQTFFYGGLWLMGLAQGYRLLDWIDERNFHQKITILEKVLQERKIYERERIVPAGMRGSLILTYLSDVTWMYVDPTKINKLKEDIKKRLILNYCKEKRGPSEVEIWQSLTKIDSFKPKYNEPELLLSFKCEAFKPLVH